MKYRSYNSELLIATTLVCDVFNDIIIDRRKHGLKRDYSKAITLGDIVQQKIEVPCILGDRGIILKSLENEPGKYKLPLIIIQLKDMKTDSARFCDLHADVFYQQDDCFSQLDYENKLYRPKELSKRRAQPISLSYDVTFITKYKEDLDQIISNFAVHFRPDVYLKWWHPRNKLEPLTSQLTWSHNVSFDSGIDYNPQQVHVYKGSSSFTFKSWLFFGMNATDNAIDPNLEAVIKKIKLFPNDKYHDNEVDNNDLWSFGDIENKDVGNMGFWTVDSKQEFEAKPEIIRKPNGELDDTSEKMKEDMKNGKFAINNIFSQNNDEIKDNKVISNIKNNKFSGDFLSEDEMKDINQFNRYQSFVLIKLNSKTGGNAFCKNVYFKGGFKESNMIGNSPSGDFMFRKFFTEYKNGKKHEFGESFITDTKMKFKYDITSKDLILTSEYDSNNYSFSMRSKFNSQNGHSQEFHISSKKYKGFGPISYDIYEEFDENLNKINEKSIKDYKNMSLIGETADKFKEILLIDDFTTKKMCIDIKNLISEYFNSINLVERVDKSFTIEFESSNITKINDRLKDIEYDFRVIRPSKIMKRGSYYYQLLTNKYLYIVMKYNEKNQEDCDIYDYGIMVPLKFKDSNALIYEITLPESKELLGLNFLMSL